MKKNINIIMSIIAAGGLIYNSYLGITTHFTNGFTGIISFFLFSILFLSKFTKYPL